MRMQRNNNNYQQGRYNNNYQSNRRSGGCFSVIIFVLIVCSIIGGVVYLKHDGKLGEVKNKYVHTPKEDVAIMANGMNKAHQTNNDYMEQDIKRDTGRDEHLATDVINKYLENDEIFDENNLYRMPQQYSVFFFSNTKRDDEWINAIKQARKEGLKVYTFNANMVDSSDQGFIYRYFTHNYNLPKSNKEYGKVDGKKHPFMVVFNHHQPQKLIVSPKDENKLFKYQKELQNQANEQANNYNLPDNGLGLDKINWGDAIKKGKEVANQVGDAVRSKINENDNN